MALDLSALRRIIADENRLLTGADELSHIENSYMTVSA